MPAISMSTQAEQQYYLITNVSSHCQPAEKEIDLHAESWKLPYSIDDADLTFDGKPLNLLYEENRWTAEHHVSASKEKSRGRSRKSKKL